MDKPNSYEWDDHAGSQHVRCREVRRAKLAPTGFCVHIAGRYKIVPYRLRVYFNPSIRNDAV